MAHVELDRLGKSFAGFRALDNVSLSVEKGEFCALLGPSGCGKSTLLRVIAGLEDATEGTIRIAGTDVTDREPSARGIAMVFQSYALYPHMSVAENIAFSLEAAGQKKADRLAKATEVARLLKLDHLLDRKPAMLSGGQRQRVAIGRALVREPQVFLFDEPLSNLDAMLRVQMRIELSNLHHELAATMIYVTHDQVEAMTMADRIVVLDHGRIQQVGAPLELYNFPANKFVASFIGSPSMNILPARVTPDAGNSAKVELQGALRPLTVNLRNPAATLSDGCEVGLRPEHLILTSADTSDAMLPGTVRLVERLGNQTLVYLSTPSGAITLQGSGNLAIRPGENVTMGVDAGQAHVFGKDGTVL